MTIISEKQLHVLDQAGIAFRGKVPSYVASQVIERYWKDEVNWWCLTQERIVLDTLSTWIASRDWFDEAFLLLPGSTLWFNADSHSLFYKKKSPLTDPEWSGDPLREMWLVEREHVEIQGTADHVTAVHITHYLFSDEHVAPTEEPLSPILLEWCKAKARRVYQERTAGCSLDEVQRHALICQIAESITPWDANVPEMIAYLIAETWILTDPMPSQVQLPAGMIAETLGDLVMQHIYLTLVASLEKGEEGE